MKSNILGIVVGLLLVIGGLFAGKNLNRSQEPALGSVTRTNEYFSTTTIAGTPAIRYKVASTTVVLGSVVITSTSVQDFWIYNWDGVGEMTASGTKVAYFPPSAAAGTYTFDILLNKGLYISSTAAFTGNYVTTYR